MMSFKGLLGIGLISIAPSVSAHFEVMQGDNQHYGNTQSEHFRRAMIGGEPFTPEELKEIEEYVPKKEKGRYFGRLSINKEKLRHNKIKNSSQGDLFNGVINKDNFSEDLTGFEAGLGYIYSDNFRLEGEYLINKSVIIEPSLIDSAPGPIFTHSMSAKVKNSTFLINCYYDFNQIVFFRPYVTFGIGGSLSKATVTSFIVNAANRAIESKNKLWVAYVFGAGVRQRVLGSSWYVQAGFRFGKIGKFEIKESTNKIEGKSGFSAFSVGISYLI